MKVYFKNSKGKERIIGECEDKGEGWKIISLFLKERDYKVYYIREWTNDTGTHYDVGSHSEFFRIQ